MSKAYNIAVIPGDGTGPEVAVEGDKVLKTVAEKCGFKLNFNHYNIGGEHFKATGEILPEGVIESLAVSDAIFLGAIGQHADGTRHSGVNFCG